MLFRSHGGAGAVGAYAVQLASHAGATVIATASGDDEAYLNSIGASRVLDYREAQFEKVLQEKVDVVFDLVGGDAQKRSFLDVATVYALQDAAQAWKDIAEKLPRVHGLSSSGPEAARRKSHGKIVLRVS